MLRPKRVFRKQKVFSSVILLKFPPEVPLIILKQCGLTVYDRTSLALTCRMLALIISGEPDMLTTTQELAHGLEETIRECFIDNEYPGRDATAEEIDAWAEQRKTIDFEFTARMDPESLTHFMRRLGRGWNNRKPAFVEVVTSLLPGTKTIGLTKTSSLRIIATVRSHRLGDMVNARTSNLSSWVRMLGNTPLPGSNAILPLRTVHVAKFSPGGIATNAADTTAAVVVFVAAEADMQQHMLFISMTRSYSCTRLRVTLTSI